MSAWKAGKVLWFDRETGEGVVVDREGRSFYLNEGALKANRKKSRNKKEALKENVEVKFTTYQNAYLVQIDKIREV